MKLKENISVKISCQILLSLVIAALTSTITLTVVEVEESRILDGVRAEDVVVVSGVELGLRGRGAQRVAVLAPRPAAVARGGGAEAAALQEDEQLPGVLGAVEGPPVVHRAGAVVALRQGLVLEGD